MQRELARRESLCERKNGNANLRISHNVGKQIRTSPAFISRDAPDGSENRTGLAHRPTPLPRIGDGTKKTNASTAERIGVEALGLRRESKGTRRQIKVMPISAQA